MLIRLDPPEKAALMVLAEAEDRTVTQWVRQAIREKLARIEAGP